MEKMRVGVMLGGKSSERKVSLNSGGKVYGNRDNEKYDEISISMDHQVGEESL